MEREGLCKALGTMGGRDGISARDSSLQTCAHPCLVWGPLASGVSGPAGWQRLPQSQAEPLGVGSLGVPFNRIPCASQRPRQVLNKYDEWMNIRDYEESSSTPIWRWERCDFWPYHQIFWDTDLGCPTVTCIRKTLLRIPPIIIKLKIEVY